ncbi:hypothetical protein Leryth_015306 [Lithospermum erythrorhizon]|nr:hypothetical protein Leryth_015306 [Lithospermum erythrorhizon]
MKPLSTKVMKSIFVRTLLYLMILESIINAQTKSTQDSDRIINLPGQPKTPTISHFSGYITVNEDHGRALFYWFFEAQSQPSSKPLLLWLNGGPGCSSVGYGAATELGPLRVHKNGEGLEYNEHSWYKEANLLFVESPVGVGFSYTNTSSDLLNIDDKFVAEDAYSFLVKWLERFPHFKSHDFFIAGESYAGHYVPQLAELIHVRNKITKKKYPFINLKGFIVGNPETDNYYDDKGILEYAWSHSVISDEEYERAKQVCNFRSFNWSRECNEAMIALSDKYQDIDIYNIYAPKCFLNTTTTSADVNHAADLQELSYDRFRRMRQIIPGGYDPCYSVNIKKYFNRREVQTAFHANTANGSPNATWTGCSGSLFGRYNFTVFSVLPIYKKLLKSGLKIWMYSGDADGRVPVIGTRYCVEALKLPLKSPWRSWYHNQQVGGRIVEYDGLTLVTVRGAGHMVPHTKPSEALAIIQSYLSGELLPPSR